MDTAVVRISKESWRSLKSLAKGKHQTMQAVLEEALETYRRQRFFEALDMSVNRLKGDPKAWKAEMYERKAWEATVADGLEPEEDWSGKKRVKSKKVKKHG